MTIHSYPTGEPCWTWRVPEKWSCSEAYLETLDGRRLLDYRRPPPARCFLLAALRGGRQPGRAAAAICTSTRACPRPSPSSSSITSETGGCALPGAEGCAGRGGYRVVIRTRFEPGTLKVGEVVIPGKSQDCFVLAAHLCHPGMVNDDLSGVVVGLDVARSLLAGPPAIPHTACSSCPRRSARWLT